MIKRPLRVIVASLLLALGVPAIASAHVLKVDGDIGGILHINPDDNPTTQGPTDYTISFDDNSGRFKLAGCDCNVSIVQAGQVIAKRPLAVSRDGVSENRYTFPKAGVYDMRFTGTPRTPDAFQPFSLEYEVRVTSGQASAQPMPVALWVGIGLGVGLILLGAFAMDYTDGVPPNKEHQ